MSGRDFTDRASGKSRPVGGRADGVVFLSRCGFFADAITHTGDQAGDVLIESPVRTDAVSPRAWNGIPGAAVDVDTLRTDWKAAFDAASSALHCGRAALPPQELHKRVNSLEIERATTMELLRAFARDQRTRRPASSIALSSWDAREMLGLPSDVNACVFNLDGVLIGSAAIHAAAWTETFDEFIWRRSERTGGRFAPFNPRVDYPQHMHGKPRLDGVREFLASRGISLPEGGNADPPGLETVHGLANRKNQALLRRLDEYGVHAFDSSRRYLELAHDAGLQCAVVSASANTPTILERSGLAGLIDTYVDGNMIAAEHLRTKPAPDTLLAACRKLGVDPDHAAAFETTAAGITAARAAGFRLVIGVSGSGQGDALPNGSTDRVVTGLGELLDHKLAA